MKKKLSLLLLACVLFSMLVPMSVSAAGEELCTPALWQLDVDNSGGDDGGMSYVLRLTDGTFVVIDGGYETEAEANNLYSVLYANNVLEGKPVIAAWFITHLHQDHYGALAKFTGLYLNSVTVNGFYYNFPNIQVNDIGPSNVTSVENIMKKWTGATRTSHLKMGDTLTFAGAEVEVLCTWEDVNAAGLLNNDGNETSTVLRFTVEGQSILFLADGEAGMSQVLLDTYAASELKSDIVQVAHHGFDDGATDALYQAVDADVLLWPMDITRYKDGVHTVGTTSDTKTFLNYFQKSHGQKTAYSLATDVFPAYQNERLDLPYTAVGNKKSATTNIVKPKSEAETYYTSLAEGKVAVNKAVAGDKLYIQMKDDKSAIRFIGALNIAEKDLESFESFGFEVAVRYNGKTVVRKLTTTTVYTSVIASGQTVTASGLTASANYLYAVEITGLEALEVDALEFVITGIGCYGGNTFAYDISSYSVDFGGLKLGDDNGASVPKLDYDTEFGNKNLAVGTDGGASMPKLDYSENFANS